MTQLYVDPTVESPPLSGLRHICGVIVRGAWWFAASLTDDPVDLVMGIAIVSM
jgi:hypothetical protein